MILRIGLIRNKNYLHIFWCFINNFNFKNTTWKTTFSITKYTRDLKKVIIEIRRISKIYLCGKIGESWVIITSIPGIGSVNSVQARGNSAWYVTFSLGTPLKKEKRKKEKMKKRKIYKYYYNVNYIWNSDNNHTNSKLIIMNYHVHQILIIPESKFY